MKLISTTFMALALIVTTASLTPASSKTIKGSKVIATKHYERDLSGVTEIRSSRTVEVEIVDAATQPNITIKANENIIPYIEVEVKGGKLHLSVADKIRRMKSVEIEILVPDNGTFNSFDASSGSEISSEIFLQIPSLRIEASSGAEVSLIAIVEGDCVIGSSSGADVDLTAKIVGDCKVSASSAADVDLTISANTLRVGTSSGADVDASGSVQELIVNSSSGSSFDGGELKAISGSLSASSGSDIKYYGTGVFNVSRSSGGSIKNNNQNR